MLFCAFSFPQLLQRSLPFSLILVAITSIRQCSVIVSTSSYQILRLLSPKERQQTIQPVPCPTPISLSPVHLPSRSLKYRNVQEPSRAQRDIEDRDQGELPILCRLISLLFEQKIFSSRLADFQDFCLGIRPAA